MTAADVNADFSAALTTAGYSNIHTAFDESSSDQIALFEGGGFADYVSSTDGGGGNDIQHIRMQIQVRHATKATARSRALAIITLLHRGTVANCLSVFWDGRAPDYWKDENNRHIYAIEFRVIRECGLVG